ncbi:hypothetical protein Bxe_A2881 [Paraburkholderia xenovorans LB400]|uniref:Uncharacterized protein n=1 Tax=Paraburkholderia xenovorans (strain LB400) TaxID=266265 RepID=Q140Z6_PARXL|nr:hypothetical protein Bxe_A2881 [Paraburkholderia xenovorans LB400]
MVFRCGMLVRRLYLSADDRGFPESSSLKNWKRRRLPVNYRLVNSSFGLFVGYKKMGTTRVVPNDDERQEGSVFNVKGDGGISPVIQNDMQPLYPGATGCSLNKKPVRTKFREQKTHIAHVEQSHTCLVLISARSQFKRLGPLAWIQTFFVVGMRFFHARDNDASPDLRLP